MTSASPSTTWNARRWIIAASGAVMMACLGSVYAWSIFARPLQSAFGWSATGSMTPFSIAIFCLGVGAVVGGRWQDRVGPRIVALTGVMMWALGNVLAGLLTPRLGLWWLDATYGAIGGFGIGMGYVSPVAMVTKWFPDRRGLASGIVLAGFGFGAFVYNTILPHALPQFVTTHDAQLIQRALVFSGLAFAVLGGLCASVMCDPPAGFRAVTLGERRRSSRDMTPRSILRTPQFYMLWLMLFASVTASMLVIGNAVPIFTDIAGTSVALATAICGGLSLFNGAGRVLWGALSDRIGRNGAYALILALQAAAFVAIGHLHAPAALAAAFAIVLLCNGGSFGIMPAFNADYFGVTHMGVNYGMLITAWGCAGVAGPILAAHVKDLTGSYTGVLVPVALMLVCATILPIVIRRPNRLEDVRPLHVPVVREYQSAV